MTTADPQWKTVIRLPSPTELEHAAATKALNTALDAIVVALRDVAESTFADMLAAVTSLDRARIALDLSAGALRDRATVLRFSPPEYAASARAGQLDLARQLTRIAEACNLAKAAVHASTRRRNNADAGRLATAALEELAS